MSTAQAWPPDTETHEPGPWANQRDHDADERFEAQLTFNRAVSERLDQLRINAEAQQRFRAETAPPEQPFDAGTIAEILARPNPPTDRARGLIPADAGTLLVAQRKTGKTTLCLNIARCFLTGEDLLGRFEVQQVTGSIALLNYEVSAATLARWAADAHVPHDRVLQVNLRGRRNPLTDPTDRDRLATLLRDFNIETVIVDPFGRAYTGTNQNDPGEVGAWLADLDRFVRGEVGARDLILTAHAGWNGERTRGSSALEDWADSIITLTRDPDNESARFVKAIGRDVDVDEDALTYDATTRLLHLAGTGSRTKARAERRTAALADDVLRVVEATPGMHGTEILTALREAGVSVQTNAHRPVLAELVATGRLTMTHGRNNKKHYHPAARPSQTELDRRSSSELDRALPIGRASSEDQLDTPASPNDKAPRARPCETCGQPYGNPKDHTPPGTPGRCNGCGRISGEAP